MKILVWYYETSYLCLRKQERKEIPYPIKGIYHIDFHPKGRDSFSLFKVFSEKRKKVFYAR